VTLTNIYQMYVANGNRAGFFVRRNSWSHPRSFARVLSVGGMVEGPIPGLPPYFGNPVVKARIWYRGRETFGSLSCPGTFAYKHIEPPYGASLEALGTSGEAG
jgi:hypothetical protein